MMSFWISSGDYVSTPLPYSMSCISLLGKESRNSFCIAYFYYKINALVLIERCDLVHAKRDNNVGQLAK